MPYALFCNDTKLSNAYPTEADVWKLARRSGLVSTRHPRTTLRPGSRCWTMTTRSGLADRTRWKIRPGTRPTPNAKPSMNSNGVFES